MSHLPQTPFSAWLRAQDTLGKRARAAPPRRRRQPGFSLKTTNVHARDEPVPRVLTPAPGGAGAPPRSPAGAAPAGAQEGRWVTHPADPGRDTPNCQEEAPPLDSLPVRAQPLSASPSHGSPENTSLKGSVGDQPDGEGETPPHLPDAPNLSGGVSGCECSFSAFLREGPRALASPPPVRRARGTSTPIGPPSVGEVPSA